jgi:ribonuclease HI
MTSRRRPRRSGGTMRDGERRRLARESRMAAIGAPPVPGDGDRVLCDGGSRGNPGPAAIAAVLTRDGEVTAERSARIGVASAAEAEYRALLLGVELAVAHCEGAVEVCSDSQLAVAGLRGPGPAQPELAELAEEVHRAAAALASVRWTWHPAAENVAPDRLVRELLWPQDADARSHR